MFENTLTNIYTLRTREKTCTQSSRSDTTTSNTGTNSLTVHSYAMVTCEIKLFQIYFSLRRRPTEIILFQRVETRLKLFQNYFRNLP